MKAWDQTGREDDVLTVNETGEHAKVMLLTDKAAGHVHELPEQWLRARVRGWMELCESPGLAYWIGAYTPEGKWIYCSSDENTYHPADFRQHYAMTVCKHVNKHCANGGAWLAGWFRGGKEFYLLWKDEDGDIQIPIENNLPFIALRKWTVFDWENHCSQAIQIRNEWLRQNEIRRNKDTVKLAQGEATSQDHLKNAPT